MSRQSDLDNHANQMNPNNDAYWDSRGYDERPDDWEERVEQDEENLKGSYPTISKRQCNPLGGIHIGAQSEFPRYNK